MRFSYMIFIFFRIIRSLPISTAFSFSWLIRISMAGVHIISEITLRADQCLRMADNGGETITGQTEKMPRRIGENDFHRENE